tara:strand:- start:232285 stop:232566 length:282 start_codon:yes stop_codon:yes gene_type:complete
MIRREIFIGIAVGIFATLAGFYLYVELFINTDFKQAFKFIHEEKMYGKILSLAAIPNLFVFFIFIKKKQDYRARGVLIATLFMALLILVSQFI